MKFKGVVSLVSSVLLAVGGFALVFGLILPDWGSFFAGLVALLNSIAWIQVSSLWEKEEKFERK